MSEPIRRREVILADAFARSTGRRLSDLNEEDREKCRRLARTVLPAVNALMTAAEAEREAVCAQRAEVAYRKGAAKGYIDGFADGQRGEYINRWTDELELA